jgi:hypothetical protein
MPTHQLQSFYIYTHLHDSMLLYTCTIYLETYNATNLSPFLQDDPLILTGPKRGLAMLDDNYVETHLKIRDDQGQDRELSKGVLSIKGIVGRSLEKCTVERLSLRTRLRCMRLWYLRWRRLSRSKL